MKLPFFYPKQIPEYFLTSKVIAPDGTELYFFQEENELDNPPPKFWGRKFWESIQSSLQ